MGDKPNFDSVTDVPCQCDYLQQQAAEPDVPIEFDVDMNEYCITHKTSGGSLKIYHCPWCGGTAPRSRREQHFEALTWEEIRRLEGLTAEIRTVDEAIAKFGTPSSDMPRGVTIQVPASESSPPRTESFRTLHFTNLSATGEVVVVDYGVRGIKFQYAPKPRGSKSGEV